MLLADVVVKSWISK